MSTLTLFKVQDSNVGNTHSNTPSNKINEANIKNHALDNQYYNSSFYNTLSQIHNDNCKECHFHFKMKGTHISNLNINHLLPKLDEIKFYLSTTRISMQYHP